ncbi:amino acid ABC transporter substrate-binding protein [Oscillospiraceae bacterium MB08-C2-2]|nr:amino acid ABC transporter substrate-binding protein [Oscillospiraceae bacterium MB08-C2-2]
MKKSISFLLVLTFALTMLAGCGGAGASSSAAQPAPESAAEPAASAEGSSAQSAPAYATSLEDIKTKGELVIGLDDTFAPMGFRETDGTLVGFDIDLATAVCEELGVTPTFQPIDWNAKEMELSTGNIDCIWNGMSATPERQQSMSLSKSYLNNKIVVMTNTGVTIASKEDLANFNIGIQAGSAALEAVQADPIYDSIKGKIVEFATYDEVILDMGTGRLDCMVIDEVYGNYKNTKLGGKFGTAEFDFGDDLYAVGFRKGDTELTGAVDTAMETLIANGKAAEISNKWFGKDIVVK